MSKAPIESGPHPPQDAATGQGGSFNSSHPNRTQIQLPRSLTLYNDSIIDKLSVHFLLSEYQMQPLYGVTFSTMSRTVLHSTKSWKSSPLATATTSGGSASRRRFATIDIFLPPPPPPVTTHNTQAGAAPAPVELTHEAQSAGGFIHKTYQFDIEVASSNSSGGHHYERFEWRHSKGDEVRALGKQLQGWKLVWLGSGGGGGVGGGGGSSSGSAGGPKSSDGNGVVAVWAHGHMSRSKFFCFQFVGSGLGSGMGDRWTLVTILTALRMWDRERAQRVHTVSVGGGGA